MSDLRREKQLELICSGCPVLPDCDEESLWCLRRFLTDPNEAQKEMLKTVGTIKSKLRRKEFDADQYQKNRDKRNKAALDRYHAKRNENTTSFE